MLNSNILLWRLVQISGVPRGYAHIFLWYRNQLKGFRTMPLLIIRDGWTQRNVWSSEDSPSFLCWLFSDEVCHFFVFSGIIWQFFCELPHLPVQLSVFTRGKISKAFPLALVSLLLLERQQQSWTKILMVCRISPKVILWWLGLHLCFELKHLTSWGWFDLSPVYNQYFAWTPHWAQKSYIYM